jgi:hypothetical protein
MSEQVNIELGDFVTIVQDSDNVTTGRVIYRDDTLIRIKPVNADAVRDFRLQDGMLIQDVQAILIKEKRSDPHFSLQLRAVVGDTIEWFDVEGTSQGFLGTITEIVATDDIAFRIFFRDQGIFEGLAENDRLAAGGTRDNSHGNYGEEHQKQLLGV